MLLPSHSQGRNLHQRILRLSYLRLLLHQNFNSLIRVTRI